MGYPPVVLAAFLADLQWLYEQALEKEQLGVAVRIKELQAKHALYRQSLSVQDLSEDDLHGLLLALDGTTGKTGDDALLKNKNQHDQR